MVLDSVMVAGRARTQRLSIQTSLSRYVAEREMCIAFVDIKAVRPRII